jgi:hypothetical protein
MRAELTLEGQTLHDISVEAKRQFDAFFGEDGYRMEAVAACANMQLSNTGREAIATYWEVDFEAEARLVIP